MEKANYAFIKELPIGQFNVKIKKEASVLFACNIEGIFGVNIENGPFNAFTSMHSLLLNALLNGNNVTFMVLSKSQKEYVEKVIFDNVFRHMFTKGFTQMVKQTYGFDCTININDFSDAIKNKMQIEVFNTPDALLKKMEKHKNMKHKFDIGFLNAPYDGALHEKFETMMFDLCNDEIVWVGPTNFVKTNNPTAVDKILRKKMEAFETYLLDIDGHEYFDAATAAHMGVVYVNKKGEPGIIYNGEKYNTCDDLMDPYLAKFNNIIMPLYNNDNVNAHINAIPNAKGFRSYINSNPNINGYVYKFPRGAGDNHRGISQDFYTIVQSNQHNNTVVSVQTYDWFTHNDKHFNQYIPMHNENLCNNLKKYLTGYFSRYALMIDKFTYDLIHGTPTKTIPWFDFSDPIFNGSIEDIDVALFRKYGVSQEIVNHIVEVLPNYYDLDMSRYTDIYASKPQATKRNGNFHRAEKVLTPGDIVYLYANKSHPVLDEDNLHVHATYVGGDLFKFNNDKLSASAFATKYINMYSLNSDGTKRKAVGYNGNEHLYKDGKSIAELYIEWEKNNNEH